MGGRPLYISVRGGGTPPPRSPDISTRSAYQAIVTIRDIKLYLIRVISKELNILMLFKEILYLLLLYYIIYYETIYNLIYLYLNLISLL
jgi:hypothetical protein